MSQPNKPFLSIQDQILKLQNDKKLNFTSLSKNDAELVLKNISYHRLMSYRFPFEDNTGIYKAGTDFNDILELYFKDQSFKNNLFNILLAIEMSFRSILISELKNTYYEYFLTIHQTDNTDISRKKATLINKFNSEKIYK